MDQIDKTRRIFLIGTIILGVLVVAGLIWAISMGNGSAPGQVDANVVFNDDNDPTQGPADAKVTVRIYSDFQCPACKVGESALRQIMPAYADRVRFIWNDFPLTKLHANALDAAVAGRCAQEQDKFWEYASKLYDTQGDWSKFQSPQDYFVTLASQLGLQADHFKDCLSQDAPRQKVEQDEQEGNGFGLEATPTFFVNRTKYEGALSEKQWSAILDQALKDNP